MYVRATQKGYYGEVLREEGQVFKLRDAKHFVDAADPKLNGFGWMEKVDAKQTGKGGSTNDEVVGQRPAPVSDDVKRSRIAKAEKMALESEAEDKSDVI